MNTGFLLSKDHTVAVRGLSALLIMLLHFIMMLDGYPRIVNVFAGPCVAAFLFISGFGLNESWKRGGGGGYWQKRIQTVLVPYWLVMLFQIPFYDTFDIGRLLRNLLVVGSDLWFVDFIFRWYLAYWLARRFFPSRMTLVLLAFSLYCITLQGLMSGQAFSFFAGYLASCHYDRIRRLDVKTVALAGAVGMLTGVLALAVKELPYLQADKDTLLFHAVLVLVQLPSALALLSVTSLLPRLCRNAVVAWLGRISYEIYIVHYNFMPFVAGSMVRVAVFAASSLAISHLFHVFCDLVRRSGRWLLMLALVCFCAVNYIFACKYSMRATSSYGAVIVPYLMFLTVLAYAVVQGRCVRLMDRRAWLFAALLSVCALLLVVQYHFDPLQIRVDRWSALANPLQNLFDGEFPYLARTHLDGKASPFPVWQVFHIPFFLMGNVGLSEIFAVFCFVWSVARLYGVRSGFVALLLVSVSISVVYEVSVRSDMITNFLLLSAFVNELMLRRVDVSRHAVAVGLCCGLWLSTRLSTALPLFVVLLPAWLTLSPGRKVALPAVAAAVLVLTFLPFYLWDSHALLFDATSPFALQTRQGAPSDIAVTSAAVALMLCVYVRRRQPAAYLSLYSALALLVLPMSSFVRRMCEAGDWRIFFESQIDITYLNASLPFLIAFICSRYGLPGERRNDSGACR